MMTVGEANFREIFVLRGGNTDRIMPDTGYPATYIKLSSNAIDDGKSKDALLKNVVSGCTDAYAFGNG